MSPKRIYLVKHGQTVENAQGVHQGRSLGGHLSERGKEDVRCVGRWLGDRAVAAERMIVSPMSRCQQSAALLRPHLPGAEVIVDERLGAKDSGHLSGRPRGAAVLEAARRNIPIHKMRTPGGESSEDVQARYVQLWNEICGASHQTTVLVGHGGGIACLLLWLTRLGFDHYLEHVPASGGMTLIEVEGSIPAIRLMNIPPHQLASDTTPRIPP